MNRERGQALVEAVLALPVCVACAMTLVDCGVLVRDRIAVAQAATRGAEAHLAGRDETAAALEALPAELASHATVNVADGQVTVRARSGARITRLAGAPVTQRSTAIFDPERVSR